MPVASQPLGRRERNKQQKLDRITAAVASGPRDAVLFGSTGTSGAFFSSFDYGHPANILDHYVALRLGTLDYVDDDSCARALPFLHGSQSPRRGVWLFYAAAPDEVQAAAAALGGVPGAVVHRVPGGYFLVRSASPLPPRALIALGQALRLAWRGAVPLNRRVNELLQADRQLLASPPRCKAYGELGDPAISPHWPPVKTTHQ